MELLVDAIPMISSCTAYVAGRMEFPIRISRKTGMRLQLRSAAVAAAAAAAAVAAGCGCVRTYVHVGMGMRVYLGREGKEGLSDKCFLWWIGVWADGGQGIT